MLACNCCKQTVSQIDALLALLLQAGRGWCLLPGAAVHAPNMH
jgi:hypothetical protein